VEIKIKTIV